MTTSRVPADAAEPAARATDVADVPRPKRTRNNRKGADRARRIMEIAEQMFHERGYAETSMEDIAQAVGLLKGSLYYYVSSKEDLLYRIVDDVHVTVAGLLERSLARADLPAVRRLETFVIDQVTFNARHVPRIAVYHHEWHRLEGDRLMEIRARRRQHELAVIGLIEEAKAAGDTRPDLDTKLAAASTFAVTIWPYTWYRPGTISAARLSRAAADFVLGGLRGPG